MWMFVLVVLSGKVNRVNDKVPRIGSWRPASASYYWPPNVIRWITFVPSNSGINNYQ